MSTLTETFVDLPTSRGDMRVHLFVPQAPGRHPGVICYSETRRPRRPQHRSACADVDVAAVNRSPQRQRFGALAGGGKCELDFDLLSFAQQGLVVVFNGRSPSTCSAAGRLADV